MKSYEQVAELFAAVSTMGKGNHHAALSTRRSESLDRKLYAPKLAGTVESMATKVGWDVIGTFADVADHVTLFHESGESRIYHLAPSPIDDAKLAGVLQGN